jgi:hypothetical protein
MLLENAFVNNAVLVLKKNGHNDHPFILFDKIKIPDGNIIRYLENLEKTISFSNNEPSDPELTDDSYDIYFYLFSFVLLMIIIYSNIF